MTSSSWERNLKVPGTFKLTAMKVRLTLALVSAALLATPAAQAASLSKADAKRVEKLARSLGSNTSLLVTDTRGRTLACLPSFFE